MINIGLTGADGRMGQQIALEIVKIKGQYNLTQALVRTNKPISNILKNTAQNIACLISELTNIDVIIDYSKPDLTIALLEHVNKHKIPLLIGTTGFDHKQKDLIHQASKHIPILLSPNTSLSMNMLFKLVQMVAEKLPNFEAEILEMHHRNKMDAPSGTALKIGEIIASARNLDFDTSATYDRHNNNKARISNEIGFATIRGGDIVGEHEAFFINDYERLSIKSSITNRASFASGALIGAKFLTKQKPGLYSMNDVLHL